MGKAKVYPAGSNVSFSVGGDGAFTTTHDGTSRLEYPILKRGLLAAGTKGPEARTHKDCLSSERVK